MGTVLQFSGGKDSLACLYLLKPRWPDITVAWLNTGASYPETRKQMAQVRALVPHFHEIKSRQIFEAGFPVDVLPVHASAAGAQFEGWEGPRYQSRFNCCAHTIWAPLAQAMMDLGATTIIRGQKKADAKKAPFASGTMVNGVTYEFPLEDWSDAEVRAYLTENGVELPQNYQYMNTGLDCWNCTAYLDENQGRMDYLKRFHPPLHQQMQARFAELSAVIEAALTPLRLSI